MKNLSFKSFFIVKKEKKNRKGGPKFSIFLSHSKMHYESWEEKVKYCDIFLGMGYGAVCWWGM